MKQLRLALILICTLAIVIISVAILKIEENGGLAALATPATCTITLPERANHEVAVYNAEGVIIAKEIASEAGTIALPYKGATVRDLSGNRHTCS